MSRHVILMCQVITKHKKMMFTLLQMFNNLLKKQKTQQTPLLIYFAMEFFAKTFTFLKNNFLKIWFCTLQKSPFELH
jgi:hypothetical protein